MNSKVSFFNYNYLKENIKKSRGIILFFFFVIPTFTFLSMLLLNTEFKYATHFPNLVELSIPSIIGMYIIPFITAAALFNFVFKKDSVDFINALPLKRSTVFITNIIGGIAIFFGIFAFTTIFMAIMSIFFTHIVIPPMMYFNYFLTFFIAYIFVFIASSLTVTLTGSKMAHLALTLILLFLPGFLGDFYNSQIYHGYNSTTTKSTCSMYDTNCSYYYLRNNLKVSNASELINGKTLPYKYVNMIPFALFGDTNTELMYNNELNNVYDGHSILKMIILSIFYFMIGLYAYNRRQMEVAETTFRSDAIHQIVKCLVILPFAIGSITLFVQNASLVLLLIMLAILTTIYIVYDLITRRGGIKFFASFIYYLGMCLAAILIFTLSSLMGNIENSKAILKKDVSNIGIMPNSPYVMNDDGNFKIDKNLIGYKVTNEEIIKLIFDNINTDIKVQKNESLGDNFLIRITMNSGATYYFHINLKKVDYDKMIELLSNDKGYVKHFKDLPYDKIYGLKLGSKYMPSKDSKEIIKLVKEGIDKMSLYDLMNSNYDRDDINKYRISMVGTNVSLYAYEKGVNNYTIDASINRKLLYQAIKNANESYINNIKDRSINVNYLSFSAHFYVPDEDIKYVNNFEQANTELVYRYINANVKTNIDFSKYDDKDIVSFSIFDGSESYSVYLLRDAAFEKLYSQIKTIIDNNPAYNETNTKGMQ